MRRVFEGPLNKAEGLLRHQLDLVKEQRLPVPVRFSMLGHIHDVLLNFIRKSFCSVVLVNRQLSKAILETS